MEDLDLERLRLPGGGAAKRARANTHAKAGRYVKGVRVQPGEHGFDVAIDATVRAAMARQHRFGPNSPFKVIAEDLHKKVRKRPLQTLIVFVVDASDSMGEGTYARMKAAKGATLAILTKAHVARHRVAMVVFRDQDAQVVVPPTASLSLAREQLASLPTGGATPFGHGMMTAWQAIKNERIKDPHLHPVVVVLSDGEANVPYVRGKSFASVMPELLQICEGVQRDRIAAIVIDTASGIHRSNRMKNIAAALHGTYHHVTALKANHVMSVISSHARGT